MMENIYLNILIQKKEPVRNINKWIKQLINVLNSKL